MVVSGATRAATEGSVTGRVLVSPIAIDLVIRTGPERGGSSITASADLRNLGPTVVPRITVRLRTATGLGVRPARDLSVRRLAPGAGASMSWSLCARLPGAYIVFAEATCGGVVVQSPARLVVFTAASGPCRGPRRA
jgi:hypothetical protein